MKKFICILLTLLLVLSPMNCKLVLAKNLNKSEELISSIEPINPNEVVPYELVVSFEKNDKMSISSVNSEEKVLENMGLEVIDSSIKALNNNEMGIYSNNNEVLEIMGSVFLVKYNPDDYLNCTIACKSVEKQLKRKGYDVKYVEPNLKLENVNIIESPMHTYDTNNNAWAHNLINIEEAWDLGLGCGNKIAILSTGVDYDHPALRNNINLSLARSFADDSTNADDVLGQGTAMAGVILDASPGSTIVPIKCLNSDGSGQSYWVQQALTYACDAGAKIITMCLGGGSYSQGMQDACTYAYNNGSIIVAGTGDDGTNSVYYPAAYENVLSVAAIGNNGARASFSNHGPATDIYAPGSGIYTTQLGGGYQYVSGTSIACAYVSGIIAILWCVCPSLTASEVIDILLDTESDMEDESCGLVDAGAAATMAHSMIPLPTLNAIFTSSTATNGLYLNQTIIVKNANNIPISGATVDMTINSPSGTVLYKVLTTDSNGRVTNSIKRWINGYGTYTFHIIIEKQGYQTLTMDKTAGN